MSTNKQSGFGIAVIIVAIVVVAILGYAGYRVYTTQTRKPASTNNTNSQTANNTPSQNTNTQVATYLDIKELGIKIKLSDSIKDATYSAHTSSDGSQYARISTQSLTSQSNNTCGTDVGPLGTITKASGTPEQVFGATSRTVDNVSTFKFGSNTYIFIAGPQATCSANATVQSLADQQRSAFVEDFKTVQLDN